MSWLLKWRMRRAGLTTVPHYAPDLSLAPINYIFPVSSEVRLKKAKKRIKFFLKNTDPDKYSGNFYDAYVQREEAALIAQVRMQTPGHQGINGAIALKHRSELERLQRTISQTERVINDLDSRIDELSQLYKSKN